MLFSFLFLWWNWFEDIFVEKNLFKILKSHKKLKCKSHSINKNLHQLYKLSQQRKVIGFKKLI